MAQNRQSCKTKNQIKIIIEAFLIDELKLSHYNPPCQLSVKCNKKPYYNLQDDEEDLFVMRGANPAVTQPLAIRLFGAIQEMDGKFSQPSKAVFFHNNCN